MGSEPSPAAVSERAAGSRETAEPADTAGPRQTAAEPAGAAGSPGAVGPRGATPDRGSAVPWRAMTWASVALAAQQTDGTVKTYRGSYTVVGGVITQFNVQQVS